MFSSLLIANRGEIACRIIRTAKRLGIRTIAVYSEPDRDALHVRMADQAISLGGSAARESYLSIPKIIAACKSSGAEAVHPGYGFLSENPLFAQALAEAGIVFVGPPVAAIEAMGDKIASKRIAAEAGVSTVPGHLGLVADAAEAAGIAGEIGYPVMIKASAGGGGKGMRIAWSDAEAREGFERSRSEAASSFGDDRIFIEKFITKPRHIEIQVLGDQHGNIIHLGERECSIQRRNQKVIEEAPSPFLDAPTREAMGEQAVALCRAVGYQSAGTVEFIVDQDRNFYFLEMNTRLQVEHPVTELVTGLDLVELMLRVAAGEKLPIRQEDVRLEGWAIECRIYAEDPRRNFLPSTGRLKRYRPPLEQATTDLVVRNDTGVFEGGEISTYYDPMISKLCTWAPMRLAAIDAMAVALDQFEVEGVGNNLEFLATVMDQERFQAGNLTTGYIAEEFPDGFQGNILDERRRERLAVICAAAFYQDVVARYPEETSQTRRLNQQGESLLDRRHEQQAVLIGGVRHDVRLAAGVWDHPTGAWLDRRDDADAEPPFRFAFVRLGGDRTLAVAFDDDEWFFLKIDPRIDGYRVRTLGADLRVRVLLPHIADLLPLMPKKTPPDMSRFLLCPMPGQVVRLDVAEGDVVEDGQTLAIVEAMKMENVLKAERRARIGRLHVAAGAVLAVDQVILEFEAI